MVSKSLSTSLFLVFFTLGCGEDYPPPVQSAKPEPDNTCLDPVNITEGEEVAPEAIVDGKEGEYRLQKIEIHSRIQLEGYEESRLGLVASLKYPISPLRPVADVKETCSRLDVPPAGGFTMSGSSVISFGRKYGTIYSDRVKIGASRPGKNTGNKDETYEGLIASKHLNLFDDKLFGDFDEAVNGFRRIDENRFYIYVKITETEEDGTLVQTAKMTYAYEKNSNAPEKDLTQTRAKLDFHGEIVSIARSRLDLSHSEAVDLADQILGKANPRDYFRNYIIAYRYARSYEYGLGLGYADSRAYAETIADIGIESEDRLQSYKDAYSYARSSDGLYLSSTKAREYAAKESGI